MIDLEKLREKTQECYGVVMISESEFIALLDYSAQLAKCLADDERDQSDEDAADAAEFAQAQQSLELEPGAQVVQLFKQAV